MWDDRRADLIADAVLACPGVAALHGGAFGTVATHLAGRRVVGVRIGGESDDARLAVEIHVAGRYPRPVAEIVTQVRAAALGVVPGAEVAVTIEDYR